MQLMATTPLTLALSAQEYEQLRAQAERLASSPPSFARPLLGVSLVAESGPGLHEVVSEIRARAPQKPTDPGAPPPGSCKICAECPMTYPLPDD
jgi:hypothetical protein